MKDLGAEKSDINGQLQTHRNFRVFANKYFIRIFVFCEQIWKTNANRKQDKKSVKFK